MPVPIQGRFDPFLAHQYTVDQLIEFMREGISIHEINEIRNLATLTFDDYKKILGKGVCSIQDFVRIGVPHQLIETLKEEAMVMEIQREEWEKVKNSTHPQPVRDFIANFPNGFYSQEARELLDKLTDEDDWKVACEQDTAGAYALYISNHPNGAHVEEAMKRMEERRRDEAKLMEYLLEDMKENPWKYPPSIMKALIEGRQIAPDARVPKKNDSYLPLAERFLNRGYTIDFEILKRNDVIPEDIPLNVMLRPEYPLPQVAFFDNFPLDRTDVFFLGVPRSGKSTVLSALLYTMYRDGRWTHKVNIDPRTGIDPTLEYYSGLLKAVQAHKPPESTATDTISYISMDVPAGENGSRTGKLNFVEISGEAMKRLADSIMTAGQAGSAVWKELGASQILSNNNSKILFFLLDYNTIANAEDDMDVLDQELTLNTALQVLTNDGSGKDNSKRCTMSKVESVAVLLTKADLMGTDNEEERTNIALDYLQNNFKGFMNTLTQVCQRFDINRNNGNMPLIFTFSAGKFYVGNTLMFNDVDARNLAHRIERLVPYKKRGPF